MHRVALLCCVLLCGQASAFVGSLGNYPVNMSLVSGETSTG